MNRKIKNVTGLIALVVLIFASTVVYANPEAAAEEGQVEQTKENRANFIQELNLTQEQQEQLKSQRSANRDSQTQLREKMQVKRQELRQELEKQEIDKAKAQAIISDIKNLTGEQLQQRVDGIIGMREVLTPEQYQQMQEKMKEKRKAHGQSSEKGNGKRGFMKGRFGHKF